MSYRTTQFEAFEVTVADHIAEVTLIGPGRGNAMGPAFWAELVPIFTGIDADPEVRAVVLTGSGKHFSYGLDLPAMAGDLGPALADDAKAAPRTAFHDLITAADVRLASADAKFSVREVRVAIVADMGSLARLPLIVGEGHTRELALTGKDFDATRAEKIGLVSDVYADRDAVLAAARTMAAEIAANPPLVVQGIKTVLDHSRSARVDDSLRYVAAWNAAFLPSKDLTEAITAVFEKRDPRFTGE